MSGNYSGNELSRAVKLHADVLGVTDIACARNSHFNIPTSILLNYIYRWVHVGG